MILKWPDILNLAKNGKDLSRYACDITGQGSVEELQGPECCARRRSSKCLLVSEERRFHPGLFCGSGRVSDAASIDIGNPGGCYPDVNVRFGDILVVFARGILSRDEVYDGVAAET